jgi:hypothetical protein
METTLNSSLGSKLGQIAWVVKDIKATEKYFREVIGVPEFVKMENLRANELEGTYYGKPGDYTFHLYLAFSGETMIELIQPVSGKSMYQDYLDTHQEGGVQHIAYVISEDDLEKAISEMTKKGIQLMMRLNLPVAKVAYFDTYKEIGVATEIIGLTEAGVAFVNQMKSAVVQ